MGVFRGGARVVLLAAVVAGALYGRRGVAIGEVGSARLAASFFAYAACFLVAWPATSGGAGAAHEFALAVRELRLRAARPSPDDRP